jgi:hypothetical protein
VGVEQLSDSELLGLVAQGDEVALRELVERHSAWLLSAQEWSEDVTFTASQ